jgi:hypothetical protein
MQMFRKNDNCLDSLVLHTMQDIPIDVIAFNVCKFLSLQSMLNLTLTNRAYNEVIKNIMESYIVDTVLFGTIDTRIILDMKYFNITNKDILLCSLSTKFIDGIIRLLNKSGNDQIKTMRKIFQYTRRTRNHIRSNIIDDLIHNLKIHNKIYTITLSTDIDMDYKVFMFLVYITDVYVKGRTRSILRMTLMVQLVTYFEEIYTMEMSMGTGIRHDEAKQKIGNYFKSYLYHSPIYEKNINMYHYYSILLTSAISESNDMQEQEQHMFKRSDIYDHILVKPLFPCIHESTSLTIKALIDMVCNAKQLTCKTYMITMLFSYINSIILNDSFQIKNEKNIKFIDTLKEKASEFIGEMSTHIVSEPFAIAIHTMRCTLTLLQS